MSDKMNQRLEFSNWVTDWIKQSPGCSSKEKIIQPDILDIMAIFKILGFETIVTEVTNPKDVPKLRNLDNGIKIVVSCTTSGMRSVMELKTRCKCPESLIDPALWVPDISNNDFVKYTLNNKEVDDLIAVPPETEYIIQSVTNHFLHLIQNNDQNANTIQSKSPSKELQLVEPQLILKSSESNYFPKQNTFVNIDNCSLTIKVTSPARYRSLDTLTGNLSISEIPEPGKLKRNESNDKNMMQIVSSSSPNIAKIRRPSTSSPCQTCEPNMMGYSKLLQAQSLIHEVIGIMENKQNTAKLNCDISKIKGSVDSLLDKQEKLQETTPKFLNVHTAPPPTKPKCRAPIRSSGSFRPNIIKSPVTRPISKSTKSSASSATKSLENVSTGLTTQKTPTIKPNPKYMHIKSTISKTKTITTTKK